MICKECSGLGIIFQNSLVSSDIKQVAIMCPICKDIKAYSAYIKSQYGKNDKPEICGIIGDGGKVLPFRKKSNEQTT